MTTYEVHYQKGQEFGEALIEAEYPEQARQIFLQQHQGEEIVVMCVIRHQL